MSPNIRVSLLRLPVAAIALVSCLAGAQAYPIRPIRLIVPYAAGGAVDAMARVFGQKYAERLGQPVLVENRPGAGGNIGAETVAKAPPDGYAWLINTSGQAVAPGLYRKLNYDPLKDLAPVSLLVISTLILVANNEFPVTSVKELISYAKAHPGKVNFGSTGVGSGPHLAQELFKSSAGVDMVHVPYKGDAQLFPALFANEIQIAIVPSQTGLPHIRSGKLKVIGVTNAKRASALPESPTIGESLPGYEFSGWDGLFTTAGTPAGILQRISGETARVLHSPDVARYYAGWGVEAVGSSPEEFAARYRDDVAKYAHIIREAKVPLVD